MHAPSFRCLFSQGPHYTPIHYGNLYGGVKWVVLNKAPKTKVRRRMMATKTTAHFQTESLCVRVMVWERKKERFCWGLIQLWAWKAGNLHKLHAVWGAWGGSHTGKRYKGTWKKKRKHDPALWSRRKKEEVWIRERVKIGKERVLPCLPVGLNCTGTSLYIIWRIWQRHCCRADLTSSSHLNFIWQELHTLRWRNHLKNNVNVPSWQNLHKEFSVQCEFWFLMLCCFCLFLWKGLTWCWWHHAVEAVWSLYHCVSQMDPPPSAAAFVSV